MQENLFSELLKSIDSIKITDYPTLNKYIGKAKIYVRNYFPSSSQESFNEEIDNISFAPPGVIIGNSDHVYVQYFHQGIKEFKGIIENMQFEYDLLQSKSSQENEQNKLNLTDIFIVHGHDEEMLMAVENLIMKINLKPIILREKSDKGRTLIEKFEDHSDVSFAIVLLSPDDKCISDSTADEKEKVVPRPRQNVILEFGFFMGKLGRSHIIALKKDIRDFELPSDISGVIYKKYNSGWKNEIAKELKEFGFDIDLNKLNL